MGSPVGLPLCQCRAFPGFSFPVPLSSLPGKTSRYAPAQGRDDESAARERGCRQKILVCPDACSLCCLALSRACLRYCRCCSGATKGSGKGTPPASKGVGPLPDLPKPRHTGSNPVPGLHRETPAAADSGQGEGYPAEARGLGPAIALLRTGPGHRPAIAPSDDRRGGFLPERAKPPTQTDDQGK